MATAQDFNSTIKDMIASFPVDMSAMNDVFKNQAAFSEKLSKVALDAAKKSTEISTNWTKDTIARTGNVTKAKEDPADYSKSAGDFASAQAELVSENLAAFAEVAKKVQMDTVELLLAAGKDLSEDATSAVKKATADVTAAAKKAGASVK